MTDLREFTELGLQEFRSYLVQLKNEPRLAPPLHLLDDYQYATIVGGGASVEQQTFESKLAFGRYISQAVQGRVHDRVLRKSNGLWAWLAFFYFDQVCPADGNGRRKVLSIEKYISSQGHVATGLEKHLLFFPWKFISLYGEEEAAWILDSPLSRDSKVVRELSNSSRRNVSVPFLKLAKALYVDPETGRVKRGATASSKPGNLRRLDRVMSQLDMTYDVFGLEAESLASLLPRQEFGRWLPTKPR